MNVKSIFFDQGYGGYGVGNEFWTSGTDALAPNQNPRRLLWTATGTPFNYDWIPPINSDGNPYLTFSPPWAAERIRWGPDWLGYLVFNHVFDGLPGNWNFDTLDYQHHVICESHQTCY